MGGQKKTKHVDFQNFSVLPRPKRVDAAYVVEIEDATGKTREKKKKKKKKTWGRGGGQ
jgi:hypothetical protein